MKKRIKKLISVILVAMMIFNLIPDSVIIAIAQEVKETTYDLSSVLDEDINIIAGSGGGGSIVNIYDGGVVNGNVSINDNSGSGIGNLNV